jgi:hypothetical protein
METGSRRDRPSLLCATEKEKSDVKVQSQEEGLDIGHWTISVKLLNNQLVA